MITHQKVDMTNLCSKKWEIFRFILTHCLNATVNFETICMFLIVCAIGIYFDSNMLNCFILVCLCMYIILAIEETFHIVMLIVLDKKNTIKSLDITSVTLGKIKLFGGVCVRYVGRFSKSEILYISLAGPLMSLLVICLLLFVGVLFLFIFKLEIENVLLVLAICTVSPILSLFPIKYGGFESDGFKIRRICKESAISRLKFIEILKYTISVLLKPIA